MAIARDDDAPMPDNSARRLPLDDAHPLYRGQRALRRGRVSLPGQAYLVTSTVEGRAPLFRDFAVARAAAATFSKSGPCHGSLMLAWVLMPDHVHWFVQLGASDTLPALVNRLKSGSARAANVVRGTRGRVWASAYHDRALRREEDAATVAGYIIANPVRAGLASAPGEYSFWDSIWLP